jgi:CHAD domain-containing protein
MATKDPGSAQNAPPGIEVEWQFDALDLRPVERWLAELPNRQSDGEATRSITAIAKPTRKLVDRYLDTKDWRLSVAGLVLRTREKGDGEEATLKDTKPADSKGLRQRLELTEQLPALGISSLGNDGPVGSRVKSLVGRHALDQILEIRTTRRPYALRVGSDEVAELALDDTVIELGDGEAPARIHRVEVEVLGEWVDLLTPIVAELRDRCALTPASLSKFEAGLLAIGATRPSPVDLGSTEVDQDCEVGQLAYAVLRRNVAALLAHEPGSRLGEDPEEVHDMRVAIRRIRAALSLFGETFPVRAISRDAELSWIASVLGEVRDIDVQMQRMAAGGDVDSWVARTSPKLAGAGSALAPLDTVLASERAAARERMLQALESPRWTRLRASLISVARQGPPRRGPSRVPALLAVPDLVESRHASVVSSAKRASKTRLTHDYHRLRIRCKKLRYCLEFTSDLYGVPTNRFIKRLTRLQDLLGSMQDAEVARLQLSKLATSAEDRIPTETVFAMGGLFEFYRQDMEKILASIPGNLKLVGGREWKQLRNHMDRSSAKYLAAGEATAVSPTAVRRPATPTRRAVAPVRRTATPVKKAPVPARRAAAPAKKAAAPVSKAVPPAEKATPVAKVARVAKVSSTRTAGR